MRHKNIIIAILGIVVFSLLISFNRSTRSHFLLNHNLTNIYDTCEYKQDKETPLLTTEERKSGDMINHNSLPMFYIEKRILTNEPTVISSGDFSISVPIGAVIEEKKICVQGLQNDELPMLDAGLVNVTSNYAGYRCLPHGHFAKHLQLSIGYDSTLIPPGYSSNDIRTFFYNEEKAQWVSLPTDSIDFTNCKVLSYTNHFTDFINGIITQPDIPDTKCYTPASINEQDYAEPLEGMNIIPMPSANNSGSCSLSYPIILPPGTNGMTPQIYISYNSDAKDGILGVGWSINIPSITVDTRWGVPLFSEEKESESYLVNGEAIVENTSSDINNIARRKPQHATQAVERNYTGTKSFSYLIEGKFDKIIRNGTSPSEYSWNVTDRNGIVYVYGNSQSKLSDENGNTAIWGIESATDTYGNNIKYKYDIAEETTYGAKQLLIKEITYSGRNGNDGPYKILFDYEQSTDNIQLSAKYGFLTSNIKLLSKITITYNNSTFVKCYRFEYRNGAMGKKILKAIAKITDSSLENEEINYTDKTQAQGFYVHHFDYHTEIAPEFGQSTTINLQEDNSLVLFENNFDLGYNLSRSNSNTFSAGGSACAGFNDGQMTSKSNTFGTNYHFTFGKTNQNSQLIDLNGDGIADRVTKTSNGVNYYKGERISDIGISFSSSAQELAIPHIGKTKNRTHSIGTELLLGSNMISGSIGYSFSTTKTSNPDYFIDVNADGFVDYVSNKNVYINIPDQNRNPRFTDLSSPDPEDITSCDTCYSFSYQGDDLSPTNSEEYSELRDPVVLWKCPMDCSYKINFSATSESPTQEPAYGQNAISMGYNIYDADSSFIDRNYKFFPNYLSCGDYENGQSRLSLSKGSYILFHIHPTSDLQNYDLSYEIEIEAIPDYLPNYMTGVDSSDKDADGKHITKFNYNSDAVLQDGTPFVANQNGAISLSAHITSEHAKSDTLHLKIIQEHANQSDPTIISTSIYNSGQTFNDNINYNNINVIKNDKISFQLEANSNVDWSDISFISNLKYNENSTEEEDTTTYHPSLGMSIYSDQHFMSRPEALVSGTYFVVPNINFLSGIMTQSNADVYLTVKTLNNILAKKKVISNGTINVIPITFMLTEDNQNVFFDYTVNGELQELSPNVEPTVGYFSSQSASQVNVHAGLYAKLPEWSKTIGNFYRGWGQFSYKDDVIIPNTHPQYMEAYHYAPISLYDLHIDTTNFSPSDIEDYITNGDSELSGLFNSPQPQNGYQQDENSSLEVFITGGAMGNLTPSKFEPMVADISKNTWTDPFCSAYVKKETIGSGYGVQKIASIIQNNENIDVDEFIDDLYDHNGVTGNFPAIVKESKSTSHSFSASATDNVSLGCNYTRCESFSINDMMDMNGDGYPDIVSTSQIQYTLPNGDMSENLFTFPSERDDVHASYSKGNSWGEFASFKPVTLVPKSTGSRSTEMNICSSAALSNNYSDNKVKSSYIDINADGLPDLIYSDGDNSYVEYNLGYKFTSPYMINIDYFSQNNSYASPLIYTQATTTTTFLFLQELTQTRIPVATF